jgi:hypothetical protein
VIGPLAGAENAKERRMKTLAYLTGLFAMSLGIVINLPSNAVAQTTLFFEDFDDGVADGFTEVGGAWSVAAGIYYQAQTLPAGPFRSWVGVPAEYTIEVDCRAVSGEQTKVIYAHADTMEEYRVDFWLDRSRLCIPEWGQGGWTRSYEVGGLSLSYAQTYRVKIEVSLAGVKVWVNNVLQHDQTWANGQPLGDGKVGVGTYVAVSGFDNFRAGMIGAAESTMLFEDFNDGIADRFTTVDGAWGVIAGEYVQMVDNPPGPYRSWVSLPLIYDVEVDCRSVGSGETKVIYAHADTTEDYRVDFWQDRSRLSMPALGQAWGTRNVTVGGLDLGYNQEFRVRIAVGLAGVKVWVNDVLQHDQPWADEIPLGDMKVGVGTYAGASAFDNFSVYLGAETVSGASKTRYVDSLISQSGDGTSWGNAFKTIQAGINAASEGHRVLVARGTYYENISLMGKNISLRSTDPLSADAVANTIIDGSQKGPVVTFTGAEAETCILSGFSIGNGSTSSFGGGVFGGPQESRTQATIQNNIIARNSAIQGGGLAWCSGRIQNNTISENSGPSIGVGLAYCSGPVLNNTISGNSSLEAGGGLAYCDGLIEANAIDRNTSISCGAGAYRCSGTIRNNTITGNTATGEASTGGGLYGCDGTVENNTVSENSAARGGGLAYCSGTILKNTITKNSASGWGGGLFACQGEVQSNTISENTAGKNGGGLYACSGTIIENTISLNSSGGEGGGLLVCDGVIQSNQIKENSANYGGGLAVCDGVIRYNSITGNSAATDGGGLASCQGTIENNYIYGNAANGPGGGLYACFTATIRFNTITENSAQYGGGLYGCDGMIEGCVVRGNSANDGGGGLCDCNATIQSTLVSGNSAQDGGGLMFCNGAIRNNTIVGNSATGSDTGRGGGLHGCTGSIENCIIWWNEGRAGLQLFSSVAPTDSCIQYWAGGGINNIALDPQFVDPDGADNDPQTYEDNDYRLKATSPCVDAGENADWMAGTLDLAWNNRIFNGGNSPTVDMGAYEYGSFPFKIVTVTKTVAGLHTLTWTSRPGDTYVVWSRQSLPGWGWVNEGTVTSQGYQTTCTVPGAAGTKFYRIELK